MKKILISCIFVIAAVSLSLIIALGHGSEPCKCDINDVYYPNDENCVAGDVSSHNDNGNDNDIENNDNVNDDNGEVFDQNDTATDSQNDYTTYYPEKYQVLATLDQPDTQTSTWARSDTHVFFVTSNRYQAMICEQYGFDRWLHKSQLFVSPIDDLDVREIISEISIVHSAIRIVGLNDDYLFVSVLEDTRSWTNRQMIVYRVCITTLNIEEIAQISAYGVPKLHHATNSIVFAAHCPSCTNWCRHLTISSICLDTKQQAVVYQFESENFDTDESGWLDADCGAIIFVNSSWGALSDGSDFVLIDTELNAKTVRHGEISITDFVPKVVESELVKILYEFLGSVGEFHVTVGDWVYFLDGNQWDFYPFQLYRIRTDGTELTAVQECPSFSYLFSVGEQLFATMYAEDELYGEYYARVVWLSFDGEVKKILGGGGHGFNSLMFISEIPCTNFVAIRQGSYFLIDSMIQGIFCIVTGELFTTYGGIERLYG